MADPNNPFDSAYNGGDNAQQKSNFPPSEGNAEKITPLGDNAHGSQGSSAASGVNPGFASAVNSVPFPGQYENQEVENRVQKSKLAPWVLACGLLAFFTTVFVVPPLILIPVTIILGIVAFVVDRKLPKKLRRTWMKVLGLIFAFLPVLIVIGGLIFLSQYDAMDCLKLRDSELIEQCLYDTTGVTAV